MFRLRQVSRAAMALCAGSLAVAAVAQTAQTQRVEVTGSNIKRVNTETVAPVEIITREQIQRSGQPTIADVLRNIPANSGGSFGESFSNSFAPGAAGISLRGLGQKTTLVLINGRRTAGYGFAQNLQDTFVDLNSIPSTAVERVEILKDGASAIYGSDAIAGVVNIILRSDYKGVDLSVEVGKSEGKPDYAATLSVGFGDLGSDKYNVFGVLDLYKRDLLLAKDTEFGKSRDYRQYQGGRNFQSLTGGGTWQQLNAAGTATTTVYKAISECKGKVITGTEALALGLTTSAATGAATNTFCMRDFSDQFTAVPATERVNGLMRGTYELSGTTRLFTEAALSHTNTFQTFQSPFFAGTTGLLSTPAGLKPFTYNINFDPGVAGNPFTNKARYVGVLDDMGTRDTTIVSDTFRILAGATYQVGGWDVESAVGSAQNKVSSDYVNRLSLAGVSGTFGVPTTPVSGFPTSTATLYNLDTPSVNSAAVRQGILTNFARKATSDLFFVDTKASTEISSWSLPGGPVNIALGAEFRKEKLKDSPAAIASSGGVLGQGITSTDGSRSNTSVFAELALPFAKNLEGQVALRQDRYSDYGTSTTPKFGLKYTPNEYLALRANVGKGFRAPTLPEISPSAASFFTTVIDPEDGVSRSISGVYAGNPNLKAETSLSKTVGIVIEPSKRFSMSIDAYWLSWNNVVASKSFQDVIDASCPDGGPDCPATPSIIRDPSNNQVVTILSAYENLSSRRTSGVDIDARANFPTESMGKFTTRVNLGYVSSYKEDGVDYGATNGGSNTIPRIKGRLAVDWDYAAWKLSWMINYTDSYEQQGLPGSYFTAQSPAFQNGTYPTLVREHSTHDFYVKYEVSSNLSVNASVINVFNRLPPYDPAWSTFYDFSQYDARGRQLRLGLNYKFK